MREAAYIHGPFDRIVAQATLDDKGRINEALTLPDIELAGPTRITTYPKTVPVVDDAPTYDGIDISRSVILNTATREPAGIDDLPTHEQMLRWNEQGFYVLVVNSEPAPLIYHWFDMERRFDGNWPDSYARP